MDLWLTTASCSPSCTRVDYPDHPVTAARSAHNQLSEARAHRRFVWTLSTRPATTIVSVQETGFQIQMLGCKKFPGHYFELFCFAKFEKPDILLPVYPDDSGKELATVLSYLTGRSLSREEIWTAMELPRSTYYDQLDKGTLITADNLRVAAANLGINRAELLTRYRFIRPEEVTALAEEIRGGALLPHGSANGHVKVAAHPTTKIAEWRPRHDAPPL